MLKRNVLISDKFLREYCRVRGNDVIDNVTVDKSSVRELKDLNYMNGHLTHFCSIVDHLTVRTGHDMMHKWQN